MSVASKRVKLAALTARTYTLLDGAATEVAAIKLVALASRTLNQKQDLASAQRFIVLAKLVLLALGLTRPEDERAEQ